MRHLLILGMLALSTCGGGTPAFAHPAPYGWQEMCRRELHEQCRPQTPSVLKLSHMWLVKIALVNKEINHRYAPAYDRDVYGQDEFWTIPQGDYADCEDYVLAKIEALVTIGVPRGAMSIIIGHLPNGEGHAILGIFASDGSIRTLDNLTDRVVQLKDKKDFRLHSMQSHGNPMVWEKL